MPCTGVSQISVGTTQVARKCLPTLETELACLAGLANVGVVCGISGEAAIVDGLTVDDHRAVFDGLRASFDTLVRNSAPEQPATHDSGASER
eukprot:m.598976 g.598976  ORF g.598976 m.598976 type:complete len:92 (-) comp22423_c0_seq25:1736-2011(-)